MVREFQGPRGKVLAAAFLALGMLLAATGTASATTINVTTTSMTVSDNGVCSLTEAIQSANTLVAPNDDCLNGSAGGNVIQLASQTYVVTSGFAVTRALEIRGTGTTSTTIRADTTSSEVFWISNGFAGFPTFAFTDLRLDGGTLPMPTTGIYATGFESAPFGVVLTRVRVTDFTWTGVYCDGAYLTVDDSTIENNTTPYDGGGIFVKNSDTMVSMGMHRSTVNDNSAPDGLGGGIFYAGSGNANIYSSTLSSNFAGSGGGIAYAMPNGGYLQFHESTIAFNSANDTGGGVYTLGSEGNHYFTDTILANNVAWDCPDGDGTIGAEACLIGDTWCLSIFEDNEPNLYTFPDLDPVLFDMGGPYHTKVHRLRPGSPGINFNAWSGSELDQRGFPRGVGSGTNLYDIGAYEYDPNWQTELLLVANKTSDSHVVVTTPSGYSNGKGMNFQANAANDYVTYTVPVPEAGTYNVKVGVRKTSNSGKFQLRWANPGGSYTSIGAVQDLRASPSTFAELNITSSLSLTTTGQKYFRFLVTGTSGSGYQLFLDYIKLTKL